MKRVFSTLAIAAVLFLALGVSLKADSWTGWISDSGCGAKGAKAEHKGCTLKCVKGGAKYVFVNSESKDVVPIANQDAVTEGNVGMEVKVTGTLTDDKSIKVDSIEAAGGK
jgi:hypothetical protein